MNLVENLKRAKDTCDSNRTILFIIVLSAIVGLCSAFGYVDLVNNVPENVSYSDNISIPAEAVFVDDFVNITIYVNEGQSSLVHGKGGIPLVPVTLSETEFKAQRFERYYYTIEQRDKDRFGDEMPAEVNTVLFGINGKDIYQFSYIYSVGSIVAEKNSFGPWILDKIEPDYDVSGFEFRKTEGTISFTSTFELDNQVTWWNAALMGFLVYGVVTFFITFFANVALFTILKVGIFMAEHGSKKEKAEE